MNLEFHKMQGAGNDFVVLDYRARPFDLGVAQMAVLFDRHFGVGCDQIIVLQAPREPGSDASIRFFNQDGSESAACGNGTRCAAALIAAELASARIRLDGLAGPLDAEVLQGGQVQVDMGPARLAWHDVPLSREMDTLHLDIEGGPAACSMGNPHATLFVEDLAQVDARELGPTIERNPLFQDRCNVGFAQVLAPDRIRLVVWERGAGLTLACGSGACAAVVNAHRRGLSARNCTVEMPGGILQVAWREDGHVLLSGPTAVVFTGCIEVAAAS